jgi:hypothetical protein
MTLEKPWFARHRPPLGNREEWVGRRKEWIERREEKGGTRK